MLSRSVVGVFGEGWGMRCGLALARSIDLEEEGEHQREAPERGASVAKEGERYADDGHQS